MPSRWTADEDQTLTELWNAGTHVDAIATTLGRTRKAIYGRIPQLGLSGSRKTAHYYLPDAGLTARCAECGTPFTRRRLTTKLCGQHQCRLARRRVQDPVLRTDGICPRCGTNPRAARPDGTLRSWCRPCETRQVAAYLRTEAGKKTQRRYEQSEKGKAARARASRAHRDRQKPTAD